MDIEKRIKIVALSDLHCKFPRELPAGDILIVAGDLTYNGSAHQLYEFIQWLDCQPHRIKIVTAGNHDVCLDTKNYLRLKLPTEPIADPQQLRRQL